MNPALATPTRGAQLLAWGLGLHAVYLLWTPAVLAVRGPGALYGLLHASVPLMWPAWLVVAALSMVGAFLLSSAPREAGATGLLRGAAGLLTARLALGLATDSLGWTSKALLLEVPIEVTSVVLLLVAATRLARFVGGAIPSGLIVGVALAGGLRLTSGGLIAFKAVGPVVVWTSRLDNIAMHAMLCVVLVILGGALRRAPS